MILFLMFISIKAVELLIYTFLEPWVSKRTRARSEDQLIELP